MPNILVTGDIPEDCTHSLVVKPNPSLGAVFIENLLVASHNPETSTVDELPLVPIVGPTTKVFINSLPVATFGDAGTSHWVGDTLHVPVFTNDTINQTVRAGPL